MRIEDCKVGMRVRVYGHDATVVCVGQERVFIRFDGSAGEASPLFDDIEPIADPPPLELGDVVGESAGKLSGDVTRPTKSPSVSDPRYISASGVFSPLHHTLAPMPDYSSPDYKSDYDRFVEAAEEAESPPPKPSRYVRTGNYNNGYELVRQKSTGYQRWVSMRAIRADGIEIAFYDADPSFLP